MDLNLCYRSFVVDDRELIFHSVLGTVPSFHDEEGNLYCAAAAFQQPDADLARDPLSTNHRSTDTTQLAMCGTLIVASSTRDYIRVLIPDTVGTMVNVDSPLVLQHVVGLRLGTPVDLSSSLPPADLDHALCDNSVLPSLIRKKISYWSEINPILQKWQRINDTKCPECNRVIPINMARHLRLEHTTCQCFWRCPIANCPSWFASEFEGKDHLEETHLFNEGHGCSYYECLRQVGLEWFGRRSFFDWIRHSGQALRMDIALARKSGQELHNDYVITDSPAFDELRLFFQAAVRELVHAYLDFPRPVYMSFAFAPARGRQLRGIARVEHDCPSRYTTRQDPEDDITGTERLLDTHRLSPTLPTSSVVTTVASSQSPVEQMTDFLSSESDRTQLHVPLCRGAVSNVSLASTDLLSHVEPLPLNQLICHSAAIVRSWPAAR